MRNSGNKGATFVLKFLLQLVFALMFVFGVFTIFQSCFRLTPEGERSYAEFSALMQEIAAEKGDVLESKSMVFDRGTMIFGFTKDSGKIESKVYASESFNPPGTFGGGSVPRPTDKHILRPAACEAGKACLCFCEKVSLRTLPVDFLPDQPTDEIACTEGLTCQTVAGIDFVPQLSKAQAGYPLDETPQNVAVAGGFVFGRENYIGTVPGEDSRESRPLYIQKAGAYLGICAAPDCISDTFIASRS
ncbi:hypothetical protein HY491_00170 [Candidatus Woesearchaeota archaeon]|nr:hypothetical protein [Candidatus Woesearchaeota archaeon]